MHVSLDSRVGALMSIKPEEEDFVNINLILVNENVPFMFLSSPYVKCVLKLPGVVRGRNFKL